MSRSRFSLYAAALCVACCLAAAPAQAALPAWSPVAATNPTNLPTLRSEAQRVLVSAEGGTFKLAVHRLAKGTGLTTAGSTTVTDARIRHQSGEFVVGQTITSESSGEFASGTTITAVNGNILTLSQAAQHTSRFTGLGTQINADTTIGETVAIPVGASAETVEAALDAALPAGGTVSVTGGPLHDNESSYLVTFAGNLAGQAIGLMTVDRSQLTGTAPSAHVIVTERGGRGVSELFLYTQNVGGAVSTKETVTYTVTLPPGVGLSDTPEGAEEGTWNCPSVSYGANSFSCTTTSTAAPGSPLQSIAVQIETSLPAPTVLPIQMSVVGGGDPTPAAFELPLTVSPSPAAPGVQSFTGGAYNENGEPDTQAGAHPYTASSAVFVNTVINPATGALAPAGEFKDIVVDLPPGFLGNPVAVPQCPESELDLCNKNTVIAKILALLGSTGSALTLGNVPINNIEAPLGHAGAFYFKIGLLSQEVPIHAIGDLRSDEDYGITVSSLETPQIATVMGVFFTFWGAPGEPSHNAERGGAYTGGPVTAFLTMPTDCAEEASVASTSGLFSLHGEPFVPVRSHFTTWQKPGEVFHSVFGVPPVTGCDQLHFESHFTFQPSEAVSADSPTGFTTNLTIPSEGLTDPSKLATPELKKFVAHLPNGVVLNPSAAGGLGSCSEEQIGLINEISPVTGLPVPLAMPNPIRFNKNPNTCPESSKVGTVEIKTSLLNEPLHGALYIAAQGRGNPFGSLFAVYLVIEDPRNGIFIKVPGEVEPDKQTGQVMVTFDDLPQVPFDSLKLVVKGGSRSPFATPDTCGKFTTTTINTPWSAPESGAPFETEDSFNVTSGAGGSACVNTPAERPFAPALSAGSANNDAGAFTSFSLRLSRNDGEQELSSVDTVAPPGFVGVLTGIPFCPEAAIKAAEANTGAAEQQNPSCPAASLLGTLTAAVGVGSTPFYASGKAYLAGAYKGDPFSIVFVTPAVAGPFDLGDVVVRAAIHVDPNTARISVKTDQIPQILDGVPLQVRSITANIDRPNFGLNPTNCEKFKVSTTVYGSNGAVASPSNPFQVGGCENLAFKPKFAVSTSSKTSRANGASLNVKLTYPSKGAQTNIAKVKVDLPKQLPSRLTTLQKACTEAVFDANPANCPKESIVGSARATTPVLPVPLVGPAYFVSHGGAKFPELILVLQGYGVTIDLRGETFINKAGITSSTFNTVPDVAVGSFELTLPQGPYSALAANGNLCASKLKMPTAFTAQDGAVIHQSTPIKVTGCAKTKTLTRAQKLKAALKACHKLKNKTKRHACERTAHKRYGPIKKAKKGTKKKGK